MATRLTAKEWIDRYISEVGRRLPARQRADLEREIRSLIEDELAEKQAMRAEADSPQPDEQATVLAVLQQFGSPEVMAARYHAPQYLIGPELFPTYRIVLGIVAAVLVSVSLFGAIVAAVLPGAARPETVAMPTGLFLALASGLMQAVGSVTIVFAILERAGARPDNKAKTWNPATLPAVQDPQRLNVVETAVDIGMTAAALILLNYFAGTGSGAYYNNGQWHTFPLFSAEFLQYVPWLTFVWLLDILVNTILLGRRRWEASTRVATAIVAGAGAVVYYQMLTGGPLAAWPAVDPAFKLVAAVLFVISLLEIAKQVWRLVGHAPQLQQAVPQ